MNLFTNKKEKIKAKHKKHENIFNLISKKTNQNCII
jgi:hypothetical protein